MPRSRAFRSLKPCRFRSAYRVLKRGGSSSNDSMCTARGMTAIIYSDTRNNAALLARAAFLLMQCGALFFPRSPNFVYQWRPGRLHTNVR